MKVVLVDGNNLVHRVARAIYARTTQIPVELIVHTIMDNILHSGMDSNVLSNRFMMFWDSPVSRRKEIFPAYKQNRAARIDRKYARGIRLVFERIKDVLRRAGFPQYELRGYEADDLIAVTSHVLLDPAIILTSDSDLWQCIDDLTTWFDYGRQKLYDLARFNNEFGDPRLYGNVLAIAGCSSDGVPGVGGVGEINAWKFMRGEDIPAAKKRAIQAGAEIVKFNRKLVELPFPGTPWFPLQEPVFDLGFIEKAMAGAPGLNLKLWANFCRGRMSGSSVMLSKARKVEYAKNS